MQTIGHSSYALIYNSYYIMVLSTELASSRGLH